MSTLSRCGLAWSVIHASLDDREACGASARASKKRRRTSRSFMCFRCASSKPTPVVSPLANSLSSIRLLGYGVGAIRGGLVHSVLRSLSLKSKLASSPSPVRCRRDRAVRASLSPLCRNAIGGGGYSISTAALSFVNLTKGSNAKCIWPSLFFPNIIHILVITGGHTP